MAKQADAAGPSTFLLIPKLSVRYSMSRKAADFALRSRTMKKCYYGMKSESFSFPLHDVSSAFSNESTIKMVFWPNKGRTSTGFKCVVSPEVGVSSFLNDFYLN